ncbi:MAG: O-antigen ligase family protein [Cyanobacteria bacterium HKST-UBA04]|nr:O-antigen ligase family protein [Cyanobacteria bacterium HKST-UBA04]
MAVDASSSASPAATAGWPSLPLLPPIVKTSRVIGPLMARTCAPRPCLSTMGLATSKVAQVWHLLGHTPLATASAPALNGLRLGLIWLHRALVLAAMVAAPFMGTGVIGGLVWAGFAVLVARWLTGRASFRFCLIDNWVLLFFATAAVSAMFSSYMATSMVGLVKLLTFLAAYLNARVLVADEAEAPRWPFKWLWLLSLLIIALGTFEAVVGLWQYQHRVQPLATWQDPELNPELQLIRVFGTLKPANPNLLAGYMIHCLGLGVGVSLMAWLTRQWGWAVLGTGACGLMAEALVLTGSRGAYLALAAMGGLTFLWVGHLLWHQADLKPLVRLKVAWLLAALAVVGVVLTAVLVMPALQNRLLSIVAFREDSSNSFRMNVWSSTWAMIKDNWLVGIGPGNNTFKLVYGLYMVPGYTALSAYSIFLEIWAEQGLFGLLAFLLLWLVMALRAVGVLFTRATLTTQLWAGTLIVGLASSTVYGLFDTIWYRPSVNTLFWFLVAGLAQVTTDVFAQTAADVADKTEAAP